jgi:hypothetical protein
VEVEWVWVGRSRENVWAAIREVEVRETNFNVES